jgi:FMN reductase
MAERAQLAELDLRAGTENPLSVFVVVGNPKPQSRTLGVARAVGERLANAVGAGSPRVLDLALVAAGLFDPQDEPVLTELDCFRRATLSVIASPTYKASFTGLLKLFLDRVPRGALAEQVAIPVMTGGAANHSLAVEMHLRPVLQELGAILPTRGLYVLESELPALDAVLEGWWRTASAPVLSLARQAARDGDTLQAGR